MFEGGVIHFGLVSGGLLILVSRIFRGSPFVGVLVGNFVGMFPKYIVCYLHSSSSIVLFINFSRCFKYIIE